MRWRERRDQGNAGNAGKTGRTRQASKAKQSKTEAEAEAARRDGGDLAGLWGAFRVSGASLNTFMVTGAGVVGQYTVGSQTPACTKTRDEICMCSCFSGLRPWTGLEKGPKRSVVLAKLCDAREAGEPLRWVRSAERRWKAR